MSSLDLGPPTLFSFCGLSWVQDWVRLWVASTGPVTYGWRDKRDECGTKTWHVWDVWEISSIMWDIISRQQLAIVVCGYGMLLKCVVSYGMLWGG